MLRTQALLLPNNQVGFPLILSPVERENLSPSMVGGILFLRDHLGHWIVGLSINMGFSTSLTMEL